MLCVSGTRWVVYFQGLGATLPSLTQISARSGSTGTRSTGLFLGWNFPALKKNNKKSRKTTASYDFILLKIPGYVSISSLFPDFFLLTFRVNSASLTGNKCQLHKEVVLIFFSSQDMLNYRNKATYLMISDSDFSQMVNFP